MVPLTRFPASIWRPMDRRIRRTGNENLKFSILEADAMRLPPSYLHPRPQETNETTLGLTTHEVVREIKQDKIRNLDFGVFYLCMIIFQPPPGDASISLNTTSHSVTHSPAIRPIISSRRFS